MVPPTEAPVALVGRPVRLVLGHHHRALGESGLPQGPKRRFRTEFVRGVQEDQLVVESARPPKVGLDVRRDDADPVGPAELAGVGLDGADRRPLALDEGHLARSPGKRLEAHGTDPRVEVQHPLPVEELPEDVEDRLAHAVPRRPNGQPRGHLELSPPRLARADPYFAHFTHAKRRPTATWRSYPSRHGRSSRMVDDPSRPRYAEVDDARIHSPSPLPSPLPRPRLLEIRLRAGIAWPGGSPEREQRGHGARGRGRAEAGRGTGRGTRRIPLLAHGGR